MKTTTYRNEKASNMKPELDGVPAIQHLCKIVESQHVQYNCTFVANDTNDTNCKLGTLSTPGCRGAKLWYWSRTHGIVLRLDAHRNHVLQRKQCDTHHAKFVVSGVAPNIQPHSEYDDTDLLRSNTCAWC